jgi:preprotein translocase subunit SecG
MILLTTLLYILFIASAIVLVVVILLQEGRGGGLTDVLGQSGQATFGVGAAGINRFTFAMIGLFLGSALGIHYLNRSSIGDTVLEDAPISAPALPGDLGGDATGGAPAGGTPAGGAPAGNTPPSAPPSTPPGNTGGGDTPEQPK